MLDGKGSCVVGPLDGFAFLPIGMAGVGRIWSRIQEVEESGRSDCDGGIRWHDASLWHLLFGDRVNLSDPVLACSPDKSGMRHLG